MLGLIKLTFRGKDYINRQMGLEIPQISALWIARTVISLPPGSSEISWESGWGAALVPAGMGPSLCCVAEKGLCISPTESWTALCSPHSTVRERTTGTLKEG